MPRRDRAVAVQVSVQSARGSDGLGKAIFPDSNIAKNIIFEFIRILRKTVFSHSFVHSRNF